MLLVDADPQGDLSAYLGCGDMNGLKNSLSMLMDSVIFDEAPQYTGSIHTHAEAWIFCPLYCSLSSLAQGKKGGGK